MESYLSLVRKILDEGIRTKNRTGIDTLVIPSYYFEHDMSKGFPLLTSKKMSWKSINVELEGFIKGITDKKWYQDRGCRIWNEWCTPKKVPYSNDEETKIKMLNERDLGPIYGFQWRHSGAEYDGCGGDYRGKGIDQLSNLVNKIKTTPFDRRMLVNSWNPKDLKEMALPPCHYNYQVIILKDKLHLAWNQRSVDTMLGLPFNIASYGLLLHLLAKEGGLNEGKLMGFLLNTHIYVNHIKNAQEQLKRAPFPLPTVKINNFSSIFEWSHEDSQILNYKSHPKIKFGVAV